jgi:chromosome segregation ATPase
VTENVENLIIEHLKALRAEVGDARRSIETLVLRVSSLEGSLAGLRRDIADIHADNAILHKRFDDVDRRVDRIERRLELT